MQLGTKPLVPPEEGRESFPGSTWDVTSVHAKNNTGEQNTNPINIGDLTAFNLAIIELNIDIRPLKLQGFISIPDR